MPLFDVPGWAVPSTAPSQSSQKRKRPGSDPDKVQAIEMNMDKLMNKLRGDKSVDDNPRAVKKRKRSASDTGEKTEEASQNQRRKGKEISDWGLCRKEKPTTSMISRPKRMKAKRDATKSVDQTSMPSLTRTKSPTLSLGLSSMTSKAMSPPVGAGLTPLQMNMKRSLDGARFR